MGDQRRVQNSTSNSCATNAASIIIWRIGKVSGTRTESAWDSCCVARGTSDSAPKRGHTRKTMNGACRPWRLSLPKRIPSNCRHQTKWFGVITKVGACLSTHKTSWKQLRRPQMTDVHGRGCVARSIIAMWSIRNLVRHWKHNCQNSQ